MNSVLSSAKSVAKKVWFREGTVRKCHIGPYAGISYVICPQLLDSRMAIFYGPYEPDVTALLADIIKPGMCIYVVGAHVGTHVLYANKLLKGIGSVHAFEPWPPNFQCLERNVKQNQPSSVVITNKAVGDRFGTVSMTLGPSDGSHHLTRDGEAASIEVEITTLDAAAEETRCMPDLLLIDVEGEELAVLKGGLNLLQGKRPKIILEHHGEDRVEAVTSWLIGSGYRTRLMDRHIYAY